MKLTIFACLIAALSLAFSKVELLGVTVKKPSSKQQPSKNKNGNSKNNKNGKDKGKGKEKTEAQKRKEMQAKAAEQRKRAAAAAEKRRKELLAAEKKRLQGRVTAAKGEIQEDRIRHQANRNPFCEESIGSEKIGRGVPNGFEQGENQGVARSQDTSGEGFPTTERGGQRLAKGSRQFGGAC